MSGEVNSIQCHTTRTGQNTFNLKSPDFLAPAPVLFRLCQGWQMSSLTGQVVNILDFVAVWSQLCCHSEEAATVCK